MKVLSLLGSARKKGNTATVLGWVENELRASGHQIERIELVGKKINGCLGCGKCRQFPDKLGCVQDDDAGPILERVLAADAVIYASPLYFWGFSAQMKALIDRGYCLVTEYGKPGHTSLVEGQRQALLVTAADAYKNNAELIVTAFHRIVSYAKATLAGELVVGHCTKPEAIAPEVRDQAAKLAARIAG